MENETEMVRLSRALTELRAHYEVVVVGSGYGASVAASRLARAGFALCVLERGREFQPGDYPDSPSSALPEMQFDLPGTHHGREDGLYDFRVNPEINVFLGCGLGGTSLVNANVALRPTRMVLEDTAWPPAFRADLDAGLADGFSQCEQMLNVTPLPGEAIQKFAALEQSAAALGATCTRPPIAVNFGIEGPNHVGVVQHPCTMCGDCVSGCNVGAKNTLITNYLPDAQNSGAEIFCEARVSHLERSGSRWRIHFDWVGSGRKAFDAPGLSVTADIVVLGAGALGSTEVLLRSKERGLKVSSRVGKRFTGNGDFLAFAYNASRPINSVGFGRWKPEHLLPVGPCITGLIDLRDKDNFVDGMVIEEGSIPSPLAPIISGLLQIAADAFGEPKDQELGDLAGRLARKAESIVAGPYRGAVHNTQTYLVMAHDDGEGELILQHGRVRARWPGLGQQSVFKRISETLARGARPLSAVYLKNPAWSELFQHGLVTVHPLGGCVMGETGLKGVVNDKCQVFDGEGDTVHDGLYVCDGAVVPRPLGVNPLLTISAIAERSVKMLATDRGRTVSYALPSTPRPAVAPQMTGVRFTETMRGFITHTPSLDYLSAEAAGLSANRRFEFTVTIQTDDLDRFLTDRNHLAQLAGTVTAPSLSNDALMATRGQFNLFVAGADTSTREMRYRIPLTTRDGRNYLVSGFKAIRDDAGLDLWSDTTTLYVDIREGSALSDPLIAKGILRIDPTDFVRQLTTVQIVNARNEVERIAAAARFGKFFAGNLFDTYGGITARPTVFDADAPPRIRRPLRAPDPKIYSVKTADGKHLRLTRYCAGSKGPVVLAHGLGVSSLIFAIDTVDTNLVEYLCARNFDVWLLDLRVSIALASDSERSTADDVATLDYPAAISKVIAETGAPSVQVVAHCYGATTFTMALLAGLQGVRSGVISQVSTHVTAPPASSVKAGLYLPNVLGALGIQSLSAYTDTHQDWSQRLFDRALALGVTSEEERCSSATCHRIQFMYAPLYRHDRLNDATHAALHEMFGVANIKAFEHLALIIRTGHVVNAAGENTYLPHLTRMALPLLFIHGAKNRCFLPRSTELTVAALSEANGEQLYERRVIPDYGHIDCIFGKNASTDVFPAIVEHLEAHG